jgi:hypothetical protein
MKLPSLLLLPLLAALALTACHTPAPAPPYAPAAPGTNVAETPMPAELAQLNRLFLGTYKARREVVKATTEPLIVANFDELTFTWRGVTETNEVIPELYQSLKAVAHVPLALFLKLQPVARPGGGALPPALATDLQTYRDKLAAAETALAQAGFTPVQQARQAEIFRRSLALCDHVQRAGKIETGELLQFCRTLGPALLANSDEAALAQLHATHAAVKQWRQRVPPERWRELTVVVRGLQTSRRLNLYTQYFAWVLKEPGHQLGYPLESRHLIFAEFLLPGRDHLDLMGTTFMDGDTSEAFFGDRWRLSRDLLADAVTRELRRLKF